VPRLVLHGEVEAEELPHPMMLGDSRQSLVHQVLEAVVVGLDDEVAAPKVRPPMADDVHQADQLALVRREGAVPGCHRAAEERDRVAVLDQHCPEPV
jgi:hypothetical protein